MATVLVIHADAADDRQFVRDHLLAPLPALGFDRWQSLVVSAGPGGGAGAGSLPPSDAILVVASNASLALPAFHELVTKAWRSRTPAIAVRVGAAVLTTAAGEGGGHDRDRALTSLPAVSYGDAEAGDAQTWDRALWKDLVALMPPVGVSTPAADAISEPIPWDADIFSLFLQRVVDRNDYNRGDALIDALSRHLAQPGTPPYDTAHARDDLAMLRNKRQFALMRRYAEAALAGGVSDFRVRRQYGQALIELSDFDRATEVLTGVVRKADAKDRESKEARGLLGRVYKQRYVNAPYAPGANDLLTRAIEFYGSVYAEDPRELWHGINTASLLLRGARDGHPRGNRDEGRQIARQILDEIARRAQASPMLDVWDCATRVEACVALDDVAGAEQACQVYLGHPDMHAFEVSATYRQFDEVLQARQNPACHHLIDELWHAVERHRGGGSSRSVATSAASTASGAPVTRSMLLRVSDPAWEPAGVPDLVIHSRLGTVLSITGSANTVERLMKDPLVIAVEDSRPSGKLECVRSLPFINVAASYAGPAGSFDEKGSGALVALVDDGIDVLHRAFQDDNGQSRIIGIWDQRDTTGPAPKGFTYGTWYDAAAMNTFIVQNPDPKATSFTVPATLSRNTDGHGTHVASIAAGRKVGKFAGGVAPEAQLLVVISASDAYTGYSQAHIDALAFIDQVATERNLPVVVNVSQGMNAGAHDGQSALEIAFNEFSKGGRKPGRVVVKSAGNERDKRGHAKVTLMPGGADILRWMCRPDPIWRKDRLELWWSSKNTFQFRLIAPSGQTSAWVDETHPELTARLKGGGPFHLELVKRHVDNGDSRLVVEIGDGVALIAPGEWTLEIYSVTVPARGEIHAWLERGGSYPSEFTRHDNEEMTLSIPGTAHHVITVGAVDAANPITIGDFSSYGPTRDGRDKPDVAAPGVKVEAAWGGTFDDVIEMTGTSMAAPHVAGAIALALAKAARAGQAWPTSSQITTTLQQKTKNYNTYCDRGQGYGVIDVTALLNGI